MILFAGSVRMIKIDDRRSFIRQVCPECINFDIRNEQVLTILVNCPLRNLKCRKNRQIFTTGNRYMAGFTGKNSFALARFLRFTDTPG